MAYSQSCSADQQRALLVIARKLCVIFSRRQDGIISIRMLSNGKMKTQLYKSEWIGV